MKKGKELGEIYGNIYIDGLTKEVEMSRMESVQCKLQVSRVKQRLSNYYNDNVKLQAVIKRYRKMIQDVSRVAKPTLTTPFRPSDSSSSMYTGKLKMLDD